jgi:hypothetical protein
MYSGAGLQEINNSKEVYTALTEIVPNSTFVVSNVWDKYFGTSPSLGYIVNKPLANFVEFVKPAGNVVYSVKDGARVEIPPNDMYKCYTLLNSVEEVQSKSIRNIMNIRDLGAVEAVKIGSNNFYPLRVAGPTLADAKPDSGRPVSVIVSSVDKIVHINCHMPNPSLLKLWKTTDEDHNALIEVTQKTILQVGGTVIVDDITAKDIWVRYCNQRLQQTVNEMLGEYQGVTIDDECVWIISGDFNDGGYDLLPNLKIVYNGKDIKFTFAIDKIKTCCPNTNSTMVRVNELEVAERNPFNKTMDALKTMLAQIQAGDVSGDAKILNDFFINPASENDILAQEKAFYGDNVGFFKVGFAGAPPSLTSFLGDSDHDFVEAVLTLPAQKQRESTDAAAVREGQSFLNIGSYFGGVKRTRRRQRRRTRKCRKGSKKRRHTKRGRRSHRR